MSIHLHPGHRGVAALWLVALTAAACSGGATSSSTPTAAALPATAAAPLATAATTPANATQSTGQAATGTADQCALVTAAEAQAAMGLPVATTSGVPLSAGSGSGCVYDSADANRNSLSVVVVGEEKDFFDADFGAGAPVTRVGSDAYFSVSGNTGTLAVWQNGTTLEIQLTDASGNTSAAQIQAAATTLALAVLARL